MRTFPASRVFSMPAVDRVLLIAVLGWFLGLALLAVAESPGGTPAFNRPAATIPVAPPIGFVQIAIPAHGSAVVSTPFSPLDASLDTVLAGQLTASANLAAADRVLLWDAANTRYRVAAKLILPNAASTDGQWYAVETADSGAETISGPIGDNFRIAPGVGFVLCNRQDREQIIRISGQVVMDPVRSAHLPAGLSLLSYPFTSAGDVSEAQRSKAPTVLSTNVLPMGQGVWDASDSAELWNEPRPYPNPFSASNAPIRITNIVLDPDKATLDVVVADRTVQAVDILTLDLAPSAVVTNWAGWRLTAANVDTSGKTEISWSDDLSASASSFKGVRLYLVTSADATADLDGDGIPDLLRAFLAQDHSSSSPKPSSPTAVGPAFTTPQAWLSHQTPATTTTVLSAPSLASSTFGRIIYVDIRAGNDAFTGFCKMASVAKQTAGGPTEGPKKTIKSALHDARTGDTVQIQDGAYPENLNIAGKPINATVTGNVKLQTSEK